MILNSFFSNWTISVSKMVFKTNFKQNDLAFCDKFSMKPFLLFIRASKFLGADKTRTMMTLSTKQMFDKPFDKGLSKILLPSFFVFLSGKRFFWEKNCKRDLTLKSCRRHYYLLRFSKKFIKYYIASNLLCFIWKKFLY